MPITWCHVSRCASLCGPCAGQSEIAQLHASVGCLQHVGRFEVSVYHGRRLCVQVFHCACNISLE